MCGVPYAAGLHALQLSTKTPAEYQKAAAAAK